MAPPSSHSIRSLALFPHPVLDVDFLRRVAREGDVHAGERAVFQRVLPVELVEEIVGVLAVAEEQPAAPFRRDGAALLHEGAERRDAGARADHDDVFVLRRQREVLVGLELDPHAAAALEPLGGIVGGDAFAGAAVGFVAHRRNQQMGLVADLAPRRRDRIGARRQRTRHRAQMIGGQRDREHGDQIDELAAGDPFLRLPVGDQRLDVLMAGLRRVGLDGLERQGRHVARLDQLGAQLVVARKTGELQQFVDIGRIVFGVEIERISRLVGRHRAIESQRQMDGFLVRARRIQIDVLADLGLDDIGVRRGRRLAEIDRDHAAVALAPVASGGVRTFSASPIHFDAGSAKSRSQSTRSTTRLPPSAASRSSIFLPMAQNST